MGMSYYVGKWSIWCMRSNCICWIWIFNDFKHMNVTFLKGPVMPKNFQSTILKKLWWLWKNRKNVFCSVWWSLFDEKYLVNICSLFCCLNVRVLKKSLENRPRSWSDQMAGGFYCFEVSGPHIWSRWSSKGVSNPPQTVRSYVVHSWKNQVFNITKNRDFGLFLRYD